MDGAQIVRYRDEFYPAGFRKLFALMLLIAVTVLPEVFSWVGTPTNQSGAGRMPTGRFRPSGGFLPEREEPQSGVLQMLWTWTKRTFVLFVSMAAVMLYYPRAGFKRYALVCGPLLALLVPFFVGQYLQGRTEVFRAEILVVSLVGLAPGIGLYIYLTWRKAQKLGMEW